MTTLPTNQQPPAASEPARPPLSTREDLTAITVPNIVAHHLAAHCTAAMTGHQWSADNVTAARAVLTGPYSGGLIRQLAARLSRRRQSNPGWAALALPPELDDEALRMRRPARPSPGRSLNWAATPWIGSRSPLRSNRPPVSPSLTRCCPNSAASPT